MKTLIGVFTVLSCVVIADSQFACVTPNEEPAQCVSIYNCTIFLDALPNRTSEVEMFLKKSQCGYTDDPLVCCGSVARYLLPQLPNCGLHFPDYLPRGTVSKFEEFPWNVLLEYRKDGTSVGHKCGGVLINERYVLTAAHCITGRIKTDVGNVFRVRLGEYNKDTERDCIVTYYDEEECIDAQDIDVEKTIVHIGYNEEGRHNDIALLRLSKIARISDFVTPICLPSNGERVNPNKRLIVVGWGHIDNGSFSSMKMNADVSLVSDEKCAQLLNVSIAETQLCAGSASGLESCYGDNGGPVVSVKNIYENHFAVGILSVKPECGSAGIPSIYTHVSSYSNWILNNMKP